MKPSKKKGGEVERDWDGDEWGNDEHERRRQDRRKEEQRRPTEDHHTPFGTYDVGVPYTGGFFP